MPTVDTDVSLTYRIISASIASCLTSLFATPLDVIKIRMQVQGSELCGDGACAACTPEAINIDKNNKKNWIYRTNVNGQIVEIPISSMNNKWYVFHNGLEETYLKTSILRRVVAKSECKNMVFSNGFDAFYKILNHEGISSLYTGLNVSLLMSIPRVIIYYTLYDTIKNYSIDNYREYINVNNKFEYALPGLCGMSARVFSVTVVAPMELIRTQLMVYIILWIFY